MTDWEVAEFLAKELMGWDQYPWVIKGWSPCTRIDQALGDGGPGTVVGEMDKLGYSLEIIRNRSVNTTTTYVMFFPHSPEGLALMGWTGEDTHPARAICLAAVEALKGEK